MSHVLSATVARAARSVEVLPAETDGALLARFVSTRDEPAFAELVRRLGPLVLGVCRRVARDAHLAEDALQATFLVLARRAAAVRPAEAVRGWLYGVAVRTAREARTVAARRRARERPGAVPERATEPHEPTDPDALRALDEEIAALPQHLRAAVALCELDGLSRADGAARLGVAEGTLSSRLAKARKLIAERLKRRGFALPAAGLAAITHAALSPELLARTAALGAPGATVSTEIAALTQKMFRALFLDTLRAAVPFVALASGLLGAAVLLAAPPGAGPSEPAPAPRELPAPKLEPKPFPKGPNKLVFWREGKLVTIDPDGKNAKALALEGKCYGYTGGKVSPDGTRVAALVYDAEFDGTLPIGATRTASGAVVPSRAALHVRKLDEEGPGSNLGVEAARYSWSPDGTEIVCDARVGEPREKREEEQRAQLIVNVRTKEKRALDVPRGHVVVGWAPDGKHFLTAVKKGDPSKDLSSRLYLVNADGTVRKALTAAADLVLDGAFSPDGTHVLYACGERVPETPAEEKKRNEDGWGGPKREWALVVHELATDRTAKVKMPPNDYILDCCWSPDGTKVAYIRQALPLGNVNGKQSKETWAYLVVCDPDGKSAKTLVSEKGDNWWEYTLTTVNWR